MRQQHCCLWLRHPFLQMSTIWQESLRRLQNSNILGWRGERVLLLTEIEKQFPVNLYHQDNSPENPGSSGPVMFLFITLGI